MPTAKLEVVGIFYNEDISFDEEGITVLELMKRAKMQGDFDFALEATPNLPDENKSVLSIACTKQQDFQTRGGGKNERRAGVYRIVEDRSSPNIVVAWQYYILDNSVPDLPPLQDDGRRISRTAIGSKFKAPGQSELVRDGFTVIWRCVAINLEGAPLRMPAGRGALNAEPRTS